MGNNVPKVPGGKVPRCNAPTSICGQPLSWALRLSKENTLTRPLDPVDLSNNQFANKHVKGSLLIINVFVCTIISVLNT